jgi:hypothetical protein
MFPPLNELTSQPALLNALMALPNELDVSQQDPLCVSARLNRSAGVDPDQWHA